MRRNEHSGLTSVARALIAGGIEPSRHADRPSADSIVGATKRDSYDWQANDAIAKGSGSDQFTKKGQKQASKAKANIAKTTAAEHADAASKAKNTSSGETRGKRGPAPSAETVARRARIAALKEAGLHTGGRGRPKKADSVRARRAAAKLAKAEGGAKPKGPSAKSVHGKRLVKRAETAQHVAVNSMSVGDAKKALRKAAESGKPLKIASMQDLPHQIEPAEAMKSKSIKGVRGLTRIETMRMGRSVVKIMTRKGKVGEKEYEATRSMIPDAASDRFKTRIVNVLYANRSTGETGYTYRTKDHSDRRLDRTMGEVVHPDGKVDEWYKPHKKSPSYPHIQMFAKPAPPSPRAGTTSSVARVLDKRRPGRGKSHKGGKYLKK